MNKREALEAIMNYFNGDTATAAEMLSDAYSDEPYGDLAAEIDTIKAEIEDETELHEWLKTISRDKIGMLADDFADMFELCREHSSDPEVCGCEQ